MAQGLSTPDPSLSPTHLSIRRGRATTTHYMYTHHQVSLMVSRNTTLVPSLKLRIGPPCEAGLSVGMRRKRVPPQRIKIKYKRHMSSEDIRKSATVITFLTTSLLLTLFCSEVKWHKWCVFHVTVIASREHSTQRHRQGRWSMESTTACMREGEWASFWTPAVNIIDSFQSHPTTKKQALFKATHSVPKKTPCTLRV